MTDFTSIKEKIQRLIDKCSTEAAASDLSSGVDELIRKVHNTGYISITENGSYRASDTGYIGYDEVSVNVEPTYPSLANPASNEDVASGKQYIDGSGNVQTGTYSGSSEDGQSMYFPGVLKLGEGIGDSLPIVLAAFMPLWREIMKSIGAEQNYMPMMIGTTTGTKDIFQGAWYAADNSSEFIYSGFNFNGDRRLLIVYNGSDGKVTQLVMLNGADLIQIPDDGLASVFVFFYPTPLQ